MKTLVLGCSGQLGVALTETAPLSAAVVGLDLPGLDITDAAAVVENCRQLRPELIVNAAAFTAADMNAVTGADLSGVAVQLIT